MAKKKKTSKFAKIIDEMLAANPKVAASLREAFINIVDPKEISPVTEKEWALTHPFQLRCGSDRFYASLANTIQKALLTVRLPPTLPDNLQREIAKTLAAYLEDIINETGVWNSLRSLYKEKYGDTLPFFDCNHSDYFTDEINIEDVKVLVWQTWCRCGQPNSVTYSPLSEAVTKMAGIAYDILADNFEKAPVNTRVMQRLKSEFEKPDPFALRTLGLWLVADNKLTSAFSVRENITEQAIELVESDKLDIDISQAYYYCEATEGWNKAISMLGCPSNVLLAQLARDYGYDDTARVLDDVKAIPMDCYSIDSITDEAIVLKNVAGMEFIMARDSLQPGIQLDDIKGYYGALMKFNNTWQQNGLGIFSPTPPPAPDKELVRMVDFPDETKELMKSIVRSNRGRRVFYCKDREEVSRMLKGLSAIPADSDVRDDEDYLSADNYVVMISDTSAPLLFLDICGIFSDRANPFYDPKDDREWMEEESLRLILKGNIPDDVAAYIQEKHILPHAAINAMQGKRVGKSIVQNNLRFLFGFYRVDVPTPVNFPFL